MDDPDDDDRKVRLQQQYPAFAVSYEHVSGARTRWSARVAGHDGEPAFTTCSFEEMELWLSDAEPTGVAR